MFVRGRVTGQAKITGFPEKPIWKRRHTNRLPYRPEIDLETPLGLAACRVGEVGVRAIDGAEIKPVADWVRQASEIRFQTREVNEWFAASLRYGNAPEDLIEGLNVNTLALPPGGVGLLKLMSSWKRMQWLNRMKAYKLFAAIEALNFQKTPLVVAIVGQGGRSAAFDAGRCLQQVWLKVTELGLSAHPYYVVADLLGRLESDSVPARCMKQALILKEQVHAKFGHNQTLHCLFRVGKPVDNIQFSGRLPLNQIMCNAAHRS